MTPVLSIFDALHVIQKHAYNVTPTNVKAKVQTKNWFKVTQFAFNAL